MDVESLSLQDLADATGIEPRTIRSYVEKGIIPGPDTLGRGASYPRESLERLQVFQLLRDANRDLSVVQIRLLMQALTPAAVSDLAAGRQQIAAVIDTAGPAVGRQKGDALEYLSNLKTSQSQKNPKQHKSQKNPSLPPPQSPGSAPDGSDEGGAAYGGMSSGNAASPGSVAFQLSSQAERAPPDLHVLEQTAKALAALVVGSSAPRSARGSTWYRIRLTHDIELSVRGEFAPEQLAQLHRIADALKLLLTKGPKS
jgi:DNA-binding transcriptional MerR regulator